MESFQQFQAFDRFKSLLNRNFLIFLYFWKSDFYNIPYILSFDLGDLLHIFVRFLRLLHSLSDFPPIFFSYFLDIFFIDFWRFRKNFFSNLRIRRRFDFFDEFLSFFSFDEWGEKRDNIFRNLVKWNGLLLFMLLQ